MKKKQIGLSREFMERLILGEEAVRRFTQDSPVLPDVWIRYAEHPDQPLDLLLTPNRDTLASRLAAELEKRIEAERQGEKKRASHDLAHTPGNVAVRLYFDELVGAVLPMTPWWEKHIDDKTVGKLSKIFTNAFKDQLIKALKETGGYRRRSAQTGWGLSVAKKAAGKKSPSKWPPTLLWLIGILGHVAWARNHAEGELVADAQGHPNRLPPETLVEEMSGLLGRMRPPTPEAKNTVWLVNRNRGATSAVKESSLAIKVDAARRLFDVKCDRIAWVIIDSGIEADHPAFAQRDEQGGLTDSSRVKATYDFTRIRQLLNPSNLTPRNENLPEYLKILLAREDSRARELQKDLQEFRRILKRGRELDWELLEPLLQIPHDDSYVRPLNSHGTHVAGILAADWPEEGLHGMCPELQLYDFRVLNDDGTGDEFNVIAALQFIRYLNATHDYMMIHGSNLSLSIKHDVANYACGRTPVCEACDRVVSSAVLVVAAAGNNGYLKYKTAEGITEGYNTVSITDPGNAENVITVGATHRNKPHTYGVSYFSSRGPTGDGRIKPDLVAPGEKIEAPIPGGLLARKDGTSMAAPHVSGAAAMLMARYRELVGQPHTVKKILCETATDLGREHYFQGNGMLDVLRAIQSV